MSPAKVRYEDLLAYAAGELDDEAARVVEVHLAGDREAAATVDRFRLACGRMADHDAVTPPGKAVERAQALFRCEARPASSWLERLDAVIATLIFDSRLEAAPVRYADTEQRIQLAFETDEAEVDLAAERDASTGAARWQLMGQINSSSDLRDLQVLVHPHGDRTAIVTRAEGDERDAFAVELADGRYDLLLSFHGGGIALLDIRLE